jgi:hypothetical protein
MMRFTTLAKKIETLFQNYRDKVGAYQLSDVKVTVGSMEPDGSLLITYDGSGNAELNYDNHFPTGVRVDLMKLVESHGFYAEDVNNWSMSIYRD